MLFAEIKFAWKISEFTVLTDLDKKKIERKIVNIFLAIMQL